MMINKDDINELVKFVLGGMSLQWMDEKLVVKQSKTLNSLIESNTVMEKDLKKACGFLDDGVAIENSLDDYDMNCVIEAHTIIDKYKDK